MSLKKFKMKIINAVAENLCVMILLDISKFTHTLPVKRFLTKVSQEHTEGEEVSLGKNLKKHVCHMQTVKPGFFVY